MLPFHIVHRSYNGLDPEIQVESLLLRIQKSLVTISGHGLGMYGDGGLNMVYLKCFFRKEKRSVTT